MEAQHRDVQRVNALYKHDLKESQRKAEFEADSKRKLDEKVKELIHRLDSDSDLKEESTKLNRKLHNFEKEVIDCFVLFFLHFVLINKTFSIISVNHSPRIWS